MIGVLPETLAKLIHANSGTTVLTAQVTKKTGRRDWSRGRVP